MPTDSKGTPEDRLRRALHAARMVAWEYDPATLELRTSENVAEVFGLPPGGSIADSNQGFALVHEDDVEQHRTLVGKAVDELGSYVSLYRVRKQDGSCVWLEDHGDATLTADGSKRLTGVTIDVTERRLAEERISRQQQSFRELVERAPFGIYVVDGNFRIASMNVGSQNGAFANVRPVIGRDFAEAMRILWPTDVADEIVGHFRHTLATGEAYYSRDFSRPRGDIDAVESYEWELHRIALQGESHGVVCYYYDSTELRQAEQALRVSERRKDEFLATLGHELRNPLAPIGNAAALLQHPALTPEKVTVFAQMIERQTKAMSVLLDDLLEVSRITTGKLQLKKKTISVASLVESALEPIRPALETKEHALRVEMDGGEALLQVDPVRISEVLTNLLTNAIKYSEPGGSIVLRTSATAQHVVFEVQDTGIGISTEQLPTVFEMFAQVAPTIERSEGGLGIGLAVAKALVEMHGGKIEGSSPGLGKGSTFSVELPRGEFVAPTPKTAEARFEPVCSAQQPVVVADDNVDAAESLAALLELDGYSVHLARDGQEALELAKRVKPVACFLDLGMPKMNGYEVARQIRRQAGGRRPFLVATTGWGQAEDRRRALEAGFDVHLTKPIDLGVASRLLAEKMAGESSGEASG